MRDCLFRQLWLIRERCSDADASRTTADGPGLVGGRDGLKLSFTIRAKDASGADCSQGGDPFRVSLISVSCFCLRSGQQLAQADKSVEIKADVRDREDGTYAVSAAHSCSLESRALDR